MSVWLTPDLKPVVGGTYFPPDDRYFGQPGFRTILQRVSDMVNVVGITQCISQHFVLVFCI